MPLPPESSKRTASSPPSGSSSRNVKRQRFAADLWTGDEHKKQDEEVKRRLSNSDRPYLANQDYSMAHVLELVVEIARNSSRSELFQSHKTMLDYIAVLEKDPDLLNLVGDAFTRNSYKDVRCLDFLRKISPPTLSRNRERDKMVDIPSSRSATVKSWNQVYVGSAANCLYDTIRDHCANTNPIIYARYAAILQSSGMGKSRMIDELSKEHFVIPINLRPSTDTGFPAADGDVRTFFSVDDRQKDKTLLRAHAFLTALFKTAKCYLQDIDQHVTQLVHGLPPEQYPQSAAQKFRLLMTVGQSFTHQGRTREEFYSRVVECAQKLSQAGAETASAPKASSTVPTTPPRKFQPATESPSRKAAPTQDGRVEDIKGAALEFLKILDPKLDQERLKTLRPLVVLAFDEAHVLTTEQYNAEDGYFSTFSELRRTIRALVDFPIFSVFLSTAGKIQYSTPSPYRDNSGNDLTLLGPFIALGFDQMMRESRLEDGVISIEEVSTVARMAQFGRPLFGSRYIHGNEDVRRYIVYFAAEKLLGGDAFPHTTRERLEVLTDDAKLACMAVRLALEFNATSLESQDRERTQVEKHMRVCFVVNPGFETAITVASSEPILAEAACLLMCDRKAFDLPKALLQELERPGLDKGYRGELVCLVLLLIARDLVVQENKTDIKAFEVTRFIEKLFNSKWSSVVLGSKPAKLRTKDDDKEFRECFANSMMHFNHFIKVHDFKVINRAFLWPLIARGAAVLCANYQGGVDVILPFVYSAGGKLGRDNVSAIFIQVKNDKMFSSTPNQFLFDAINPYFLGFFDMDEENPVPIVRMVFALAASNACVKSVTNVPLRKNEARAAKSKSKKRSRRCPAYTTYDIWCAKTSAETFAVVSPDDEQTYAGLLNVSRVFPNAYEVGTKIEYVKSARRNMNPGMAIHPDHWSQFVKVEREFPEDEVIDAEIDFDLEEGVNEDVEM